MLVILGQRCVSSRQLAKWLASSDICSYITCGIPGCQCKPFLWISWECQDQQWPPRLWSLSRNMASPRRSAWVLVLWMVDQCGLMAVYLQPWLPLCCSRYVWAHDMQREVCQNLAVWQSCLPIRILNSVTFIRAAGLHSCLR